MMQVVVLGTGPFAVPSLRALHASQHEVLCAVSRPPLGRRAKPAPVFLAARALGIDTWLPDTVNSEKACERLSHFKADLLVVCDYGEILKPRALATTRLGGINLHGSLLPKYRGAAPVQWAMLNGDQETGNTVIEMTPGLDAGPALGVQRIPITADETAGELEERLAVQGAELVLEVVDQLAAGTTTPTPQDPSEATKAPRLNKAMGQIDWQRSARDINNQIRALQPWPRAHTTWLRGEGEPMRLIVHRAHTTSNASAPEAVAPGEVLQATTGFVIATGDGLLAFDELQPAGKRVMSSAEFLRGYRVQLGERME